MVSCLALVGGVGITVWSQSEGGEGGGGGGGGGEGRGGESFSIGKVLRGVREGVRELPIEVRRVCAVQFFAWTGFFSVSVL